MKKCTKCEKEKNIKYFNKDKYAKSGLSFICKSCANLKTINYKKTKNGVISVIYSNQKSNAKKRGRLLPNYTKEQLTEWMYANGFENLYNNWVLSGYKKNKIPSCDRISDYDNYELSKLRLVTWEENNSKHYADVINGKNTKHTRPIIIIDTETGTKKIFYSISYASKTIGIDKSLIHKHLNKKTVYKNYKFKYKY